MSSCVLRDKSLGMLSCMPVSNVQRCSRLKRSICQFKNQLARAQRRQIRTHRLASTLAGRCVVVHCRSVNQHKCQHARRYRNSCNSHINTHCQCRSSRQTGLSRTSFHIDLSGPLIFGMKSSRCLRILSGKNLQVWQVTTVQLQ